MNHWLELVPWLAAMAALIAASAFFSASEAALFYLRVPQLRAMRQGTTLEQLAARLLRDPDRLLSAVLFWNLVINVTYFTLASIVSLWIEETPAGLPSHAVGFAIGALLVIIFCSEMLPKSLAVMAAPQLAAWVALPLAAAVRAVDPLMPLLRGVNLLSRRVLWPRFQAEPYLEVADLERALTLSTGDRHLLEPEQLVLQNIVGLAEMRVDELMRPRTQFRTFRPPVSLADLGGKVTPSGYLLITEPDSEEVAAAVPLLTLSDLPRERLEHHAEPVAYVPWNATVAAALQTLDVQNREVAAIVNEFGETIGILTYADILHAIFSRHGDRSERLLNRQSLEELAPGVYRVTGLTSLRLLERQFGLPLPPHVNVTVAGVLQHELQRLAEAGDECRWGPFHFRVLERPEPGQMLIELTLVAPEEPPA